MNSTIPLLSAVRYSKKRISANSVKLDSFVSIDNIKQNKAGISAAVKLPPNNNAMPAYDPGHILVGNIRPYLKKIWFADRSGGCSADVLNFEVKDGYDPKFVYYGLFRDDFFNHMMKGSKGSKMPRGDKNQILDFLLPNLDLPTQQKISNVLSVIDSKIEINDKINTELEQMAKMVYDYWFVQFNFPDENGIAYNLNGGEMVWNEILKVTVPVDWSTGSIIDLGEVIGGSTPSKENYDNFQSYGIPWITPKDLANNTNNKFITRGESDLSEIGLNSASLKKMPKGTVLFSSRAPIGYMAISREEITTNQGFKSIIPNKNYPTEFIYYSVKNAVPTIINYSSGSTFKEVSGSVLKTVPVVLPKKDVVDKYANIVKPIFEKQSIIELETQELAKLRDWLLPMLMNGQVKIGDL
jgi:type I restriction enzyme S subunit